MWVLKFSNLSTVTVQVKPYRTNLRSQWILICFQATTYNATVDGGTFNQIDLRTKRGKFLGNTFGFARATEVMNSKSPNVFRWSIRLPRDPPIYIGIASKLQRENTFIANYDEYAIIYCPNNGLISIGREGNKILSNAKAIEFERGEAIHFRFQPKLKKFSFAMVCIILFMVNRL